ncbi:(E2-independent) E3 ubiquitin-conjugating enzyme FATS [Cinclus cinclus]|uniref:(E2-independent) E3 ubiquitin-conjugating enzyme FATS n=1 Tax=Cinclus cinclus TaxID=127875 RepID=UPI002E0E4765
MAPGAAGMPEPRSLRRHFPTAGREKFLPTMESCGAGGASPARPAAPQRPRPSRSAQRQRPPSLALVLVRVTPGLLPVMSQVIPYLVVLENKEEHTWLLFTMKMPTWVTQKCWGPDGQRTCTGLQQESGVRGKSSPTKESLPSQNTALISPAIIAQIDEGKAKRSQPSLPMQALIPQPRSCHMKPSCPNQGSATLSRTFLVLPSRLEIQASLEGTMSPSDCPSANQCPSQQRGFASITVTARRVPVGSGDLTRGPGAGQDPNTVSPTPSAVPAVLERWPPPAHANQPPLKIFKSCSKLGEEPQKQLFDPGIKEDGLGLQSSDGRGKTSPSFISSVQLQVSQPCPNTIYYLDKSLNVCIDQPRVKCQKMYRSTLSLSLKCSLSGLTADGVDGIANGEPMDERAPRKLPGANRAPLRLHLSTDFKGNKVIKQGKIKEGHLGSKYPLQSVFASGLPTFVDIPRGPHKAAAAKEEDEQPGSHHTVFSLQTPNSSNEAGTPMLLGSRKTSSTTAPGSPPDAASRETIAAATDGSSNRAEPSKDTSKSKEIQAQGVLKPKMSVSSSVCNIKASSRILQEENVHGQKQLLKSDCEFPGSRDRTKELGAQEEQERGRRVTLPRVTLPRVTLPGVTLPRACSPGVTWEKNLLTWPQSSSQLGKNPAAPWTLREALEIHNPQFISRSQKRLRRLELMVQLRRAQQREAPPGTPRALTRKLSTPTASRKKQFTIPDPLSDNLFKPKERVIPEKEMHMRSKRIYDTLPEVKKKQEEKQKRIIIQSNRLRVEMFKKQLLDQLLHRNTE